MVLPSSLVILLKGGGRVACCDLRWMQGYRGGRHSHPPRPAHAETCALPKLTRPDPRTPRRALCPSSPAQPWAQSFPPADPPIASQSITRGALFPGGDGEHLEWSFQARLLLAPQRWIGLRLRLAGCRALSLRSPLGDGETQCSKIDSGKAPDRSSLRSQGVTPHCGSTLA